MRRYSIPYEMLERKTKRDLSQSDSHWATVLHGCELDISQSPPSRDHDLSAVALQGVLKQSAGLVVRGPKQDSHRKDADLEV